MKGKQDMITKILAAVIPSVITEVFDRVGKLFDDEEETKPVKKKRTVKKKVAKKKVATKKTYDTTKLDNKVRKSIRDDWKEYKKTGKIEGSIINNQQDFADFVNDKYGINKGKITLIKIAKGV